MKINNILVTGRIYKEVQQFIESYNLQKQFRFIAEDQLAKEDFDWADSYVGFGPSKNFEFRGMKWVHSLGAGVDRYVSYGEWPKDVLLTRTVCNFGEKISQYCLSYILKDIQYHDSYKKSQQDKHWSTKEPELLSSQKVVIFGTGVIGQDIAKCFDLFGVKVIGVSSSGRLKEGFEQVVVSNEVDAILESANWVINTMPLTAETKKYFDKEKFSCLQNAGFINVGRGASVEHNALIDALDKKHLKIAVLDVFEEEPLPVDSNLWDREDITITPHISAVTSPKEAIDCFLDTLKRIEAGEKLINEVDLDRGY